MWPTDRSVIMLRYKQNCTEQKKKEINIFIHISKERDPPKDKTTIWTTGETDIIVCASWFILYTGCCKTDGHLFHGHSVNDDSGDFQRAGKYYFFFLRNQQIHHLVLVISLAKILGGPFIHWYIVFFVVVHLLNDQLHPFDMMISIWYQCIAGHPKQFYLLFFIKTSEVTNKISILRTR